MEPVRIVEEVIVLPPPVEEVPVEVKQIELEPAETTEGPIDIPQIRYITIEQIVPTEEGPIDIP